MPKPTPHYRIEPISRGSMRGGKVRRPARLGGSMAARIIYITRGGDLASRADEVISHGFVGSQMGDWSCVDRAERRKDAIVGRELVASVPHLFSHETMDRIGRTHATEISELLSVPVYYAAHRASQEPGSDWRNAHIHFDWPARQFDAEGQPGEKTHALDNKNTSGAVVAQLRAKYQDLVNRELAAVGRNDRLDLRSFAAQGLSVEALTRVPKLEFQRARRGEIYSPHYAKNQALIAIRTTKSVVANAAASFDRICRGIAAGIVIRRRAARAYRRRTASRGVDCARTQASATRGGFSGDRGGITHHGNSHRPRSNRTAIRTDLADSRSPGERSTAPVPNVDVGGTPGRNWGGRAPATEHPQMAARTEDPGPLILTPLLAAHEKLPWMAKIARWLGGASQREVVDDAHATQSLAPKGAQTVNRADTSVGDAIEDKDPADQPSDGENEDVKPERGAPSEEVDAVIGIPLPLVYVETQNGGKYYVRREDWMAACAERATNVPTCDWRGGPVSPGEKTSLRRTTVEKSRRTLMSIPNVDAYTIPQEQTQERGLNIEGL